MARYRGPETKIARKFGEAIFGYDKAFDKKNYPPGQHGLMKKRKQQKEYGLQLQEKQKAKYTYGVLERQFRNLFEKASRKEGVTGAVLLQMLESRLDNVVFRLGLSPSRRAARQLVSHGHILVNGKPVNIPSYLMHAGDKVTLREKSRDLDMVKESLAGKGKPYAWLDWNMSSMEGTYIAVPEREQIPENIKEQLIVELYSK
ncbi:MAG: 30S ribosomal protein S4 [Sphingobacteriales bacterium]|jgi:small subunit ribosomal protein S4|nr:30S ribosomal protein S4 [Sphingobacteriales bacterium]MCC7222609.1 30S ribosomal protein S4 [Chitinophagales bacterium]